VKSQNEAALRFELTERIARELWLRGGAALSFTQCWATAELYTESRDAKYDELVVQPYAEAKTEPTK
jgi:hypothetical protein